MEALSDNFIGLIAIILIFGLPIIAVVMVFISGMKKNRLDKEVRQLIIENHTDAETAKLLIDEPKKQKEEIGPFNVGTLRTACILLGLGLGALLNWALEPFGFGYKDINFWIILACGVGIGMLCSFFVEMHLYKKYGTKKPDENAIDDPAPANVNNHAE